ncbi:MAG: hypothetical protein CMI63_15465 [Parvularcula sp.]|nr:hypothetical protein [Parvularcula sp.]
MNTKIEYADPAETLYYSEGGEDFLLWSIFGYKRFGTFVDVGAFDGRYLSNSLSFAKAGWKGVCVEPVKEYFDLCKINQPGSICLNAACVGDPDLETVSFQMEPLGVYSRLELEAGAKERLKNSYDRYGADLGGFEEVSAPATTVAEIIERHLAGEAPDFLSIDVEGNEITVLEGAGLSQHRPRVIVAEANDEEHKAALVSYLQAYDYDLVRSLGNNHFFAFEPDLIERGRTIPVKCVIERHQHPKGLQFTFRGIALGKIIDEPSDTAREALRKQLQSAEHKIDQLENRKSELIRSLERERAELSQSTDKNTRLERTENHLRARISEFEAKLAEVRAIGDEKSQAIDTLEKKLSDAEEHMARHFLIPRFWPFKAKKS